jgi:glycosyltransferase involved in cell wall biosynthesis
MENCIAPPAPESAEPPAGRMRLAVIVPVHNEELSIAAFVTALEAALDGLDTDYSVLFVDDGSQDGTVSAIKRLAEQGRRVSLLKLSRNFGKEAALTAGLDAARADAVVVMDVDLQDPPELIPEFIRLWREGYHVVYGARRSREGDGYLKRLTAFGFYSIFNAFSPMQIPPDAGDFRLMDRRVVEAVKRLPERERFMKGLFAWVGFRHIGVPYDRRGRAHGASKWNYVRLFRFAIDGITSFSSLPLTIWTAVGFVISLLSALWGLFILMRTLLFGIDAPGYASTMLIILFLGGIQLLGLGIIGEYLGRVYREVKRRPIYILDEESPSAPEASINADAGPDEAAASRGRV